MQVSEAFYRDLREALYVDVKVPEGFQTVYTPLHGVGKQWIQKAFDVFGLPGTSEVAQLS